MHHERLTRSLTIAHTAQQTTTEPDSDADRADDDQDNDLTENPNDLEAEATSRRESIFLEFGNVPQSTSGRVSVKLEKLELDNLHRAAVYYCFKPNSLARTMLIIASLGVSYIQPILLVGMRTVATTGHLECTYEEGCSRYWSIAA